MNSRTRRPIWWRLIRGVLLAAVLLGGAALIAVWQVGAWNMLYDNKSHDTDPPYFAEALRRPAILVFSKTNSFRHKEGIAGGNEFFRRLALKNEWGFFHTENGAVFNAADLARFDAVIFNNASGDMLNEEQEQAFQNWMMSGGGWLGVHAAGDSSHLSWQWYRDNLIGATFTAHIMGPQFQIASIETEDYAHPVLRDIPLQWSHEEEWYSWAQSPREEGFHILATINEDSYSPEQNAPWVSNDLRMGDHPVVWANCVGKGRSLYSAMGHRSYVYMVPHIRTLMDNGLKWVMGLSGEQCGAGNNSAAAELTAPVEPAVMVEPAAVDESALADEAAEMYESAEMDELEDAVEIIPLR